MSAAVRLCECGCRQPTEPYRRTCAVRGQVAGQPSRFIRGHAGVAAAARMRSGLTARPTPIRPAAQSEPATEGERYVLQLRYASERFIGALHDEGDAAVVAAWEAALSLPQPDGVAVDPAVALATVLAAQVDPDAPRAARLGWTDGLGVA